MKNRNRLINAVRFPVKYFEIRDCSFQVKPANIENRPCDRQNTKNIQKLRCPCCSKLYQIHFLYPITPETMYGVCVSGSRSSRTVHTMSYQPYGTFL